MVVDTSAIVAIIRKEPEREAFAQLLATAEDPLISAASLLECSIVAHRRLGPHAVSRLDDLLQRAGVRVMAVDLTQALAAREAWARYGRTRSPAKLNFGDCFSYALAATTGRPLLYKGDDFAQTDVVAAAQT